MTGLKLSLKSLDATCTTWCAAEDWSSASDQSCLKQQEATTLKECRLEEKGRNHIGWLASCPHQTRCQGCKTSAQSRPATSDPFLRELYVADQLACPPHKAKAKAYLPQQRAAEVSVSTCLFLHACDPCVCVSVCVMCVYGCVCVCVWHLSSGHETFM